MSNMPEDYFDNAYQFEEAMKENTTIKEVTFDGDFLVCLKPDDRAIIVSCLGRLPNLEKVVLKDSRLMIGICMANLVKNSPKLSELRLIDCTLQGIPDDFDKFKKAISENQTMKSLHLEGSSAANDDVKLDIVLEGLKGLSIEVLG